MSKQAFNVTVLDSGLRVVTDYLPEAQTISPFWHLQSGSDHDLDDAVGAAHFFEHLMACGNSRYPSFDLLDVDEKWGTSTQLATGPEATFLSTTCLPRRVSEFIDMAGAMVCHQILASDEIERQRAIIRQEYMRSAGNPDDKFMREYFAGSFGNKGFSRPVLGTLDSIMRMSRENLDNYRRSFYKAEDMVFGISGPVPHDHVVKLVDLAFKDVTRGKNAPLPPVEFVAETGVWLPSESNAQRMAMITDITGMQKGVGDIIKFLGPKMDQHMRNAGVTYTTAMYSNLYKAGGFAPILFDTEPDLTAKSLGHLKDFLSQGGEALITRERYDALQERQELVALLSHQMTETRSDIIRSYFDEKSVLKPFEECIKRYQIGSMEQIHAQFNEFIGRNMRVFTTGPCREVGEFDIKGKANLKPPEPETP